MQNDLIIEELPYIHIDQLLKIKQTLKNLVQFHSSYKYYIYAKSHNAYKTLGNIVANRDKKDTATVLKEYKINFLKTIKIKATIENTYNVILHIYGYFKNLINKQQKEHLLESFEKFKNKTISLSSVIEFLNYYVDKFDIKYLKTQIFLNPNQNPLGQ